VRYRSRSQAIRSAWDRSSETLLTFALREVERVISEQSGTNRETINQLWDILDDPHVNALGLPQNSRMTFRGSRFCRRRAGGACAAALIQFAPRRPLVQNQMLRLVDRFRRRDWRSPIVAGPRRNR
jgi:hypothetical protein